ncbi:MAG TPA: peptidase [Ignavibacteriales bacterium]|nr:peptidase [Ignavibacteriales bacterium]
MKFPVIARHLALWTGFILTLSQSNIFAQYEDPSMLKEKIRQYAPFEIKYDSTLLSQNEKICVEKLFQASRIIDSIFLKQVYSKNIEIKNQLEKDTSEKAKLTLEYFTINMGPFDRLDHNRPFFGNEEKPLGANFYPSDMTKEEFQNWIDKHPLDKDKFTSEFTIIRREKGSLKAIPYTEAYKGDLSRAAALLREAGKYTENRSLKKYLELRARAFETNDYYDSDMAWMDLKDNTIEFIIGPYEVYEDELFNYKASYESFLTIKDPVESKKLEKFGSYLKEIEENLPLEEKYKNSSRGLESPIVVVQEVYSAGDTRAGVQTLAFNLPNDERVRAAKGSKKVMLKNMHEAKFEKLLMPIARIVLDPSQMKYVTFDGFFSHTLMHEMSHGVGPGFITVKGEKTEVKKALKETYSKLEECKADVLGMYNNIFMIKKGVYPAEFAYETYATFLAGIFRSVRFGVNEAHGAGNAIIYNYLLEKGGYEFDSNTEKVRVNFEKIYPALKDLAEKILTIQATGNYEGAQDLIAKYAVDSPSINLLRQKLKSLPVDIRPVFQIEEQMK